MKTTRTYKFNSVRFPGVRRMVSIRCLLALILICILALGYFKIKPWSTKQPRRTDTVFSQDGDINKIQRNATLLNNDSKMTSGNYPADSVHFLWQQLNRSDPCSRPRRNTDVDDILCMKKPEFLPNFKNPCWYDSDRLRCLPYFHVMGVCKSGTTDFFRRLFLHPDIIPNRGIFGKEIRYWSWNRFETKENAGSRHKMTFQNFTDQFRSDIIVNSKIKKGDSNDFYPAITGHGDPMDFWDIFDWKKIPQNDPAAEEPLWTTPFAVRHINPDVKLILMIREPVERLYSHFFHGGFGKTSAEFTKKAEKALDMWKECIGNRTMRACVYDPAVKTRMRFPLYSSLYPIHLREWLSAFPKSHLYVIRTEDYVKDITGTLSRVFDYLELDQPSKSVMDQMKNLTAFYVTKRKIKAGEMDPRIRTLLVQFFKPYMIEFADMLGDNRFLWNDMK